VLFHLRLAEYLFDTNHPAWLLITDLFFFFFEKNWLQVGKL
jgi:hypothetical protein